jgi:hypothetical protein
MEQVYEYLKELLSKASRQKVSEAGLSLAGSKFEGSPQLGNKRPLIRLSFSLLALQKAWEASKNYCQIIRTIM